MAQDFHIEIPKPCRAGWKDMEQAEKGRFCAECSKIVIDFTQMSTDEIKNYFLNHKDQRICGHFKSYQIKRKMSHTEQLLVAFEARSRKISYRIPRVAALFIASGLLSLFSSCMGAAAPNLEPLSGDSIYVTPEMQARYDSIEKYVNDMAKRNDSITRSTKSENPTNH
ncbi:MAG: hypothetical protein ACJ77K_16645 [Bacteroidia bacterium]